MTMDISPGMLFCLLSVATLGAFALWPLSGKKDSWIAVKDRTPRAGQPVLTRAVIDGETFVDIGVWYPAGSVARFEDVSGDFCFVGVTHWQPLPAKEKKR